MVLLGVPLLVPAFLWATKGMWYTIFFCGGGGAWSHGFYRCQPFAELCYPPPPSQPRLGWWQWRAMNPLPPGKLYTSRHRHRGPARTCPRRTPPLWLQQCDAAQKDRAALPLECCTLTVSNFNHTLYPLGSST